MFKKWSIVAVVAILAALVVTSCKPTVQTVVVAVPGEAKEIVVTATPAPAGRPNILRLNLGPGDVPTIDPALSTDTSSVQIVDELTVGLSRLDEVTLEIHPGMAEKWDISEDGTVYTFYLLQGIPWVRWNGSAVEEVRDEEGNVRYVTAYDFEYGIKRTCNPETASDYAYVLVFAIKGCDELNSADLAALSDEEKQALFDGVGAKALDDYTLQVTFNEPAAYNLNIIGMWVAHAQPQWLIEERGDRWTEPGFNQSYGPYALKEWVHDSYITLVKNPFWPGTEYVPQASIDEIKFSMLDASPAFAEYEAGNLDVAGVPLDDIDRVKADPVLSQELLIAPYACTYYYGFNTQKPPVDNPRLRRALSLAIDRQGLIDNVLRGGQQAAQWFCRPGMAACPTPEQYPDLGVKYDPEKAKAELKAYMDEMGYTDVSQIPEIILMFNTSEGHKKIAEAISAMWKETLGIQVTVTNQEWKVYLKTIRDPEATPHIWRLGWCMDYPDANNWTREVMSKGGSSNPVEGGGLNWENPKFEELVVQAAREMDLAKRMDLYAQAEQILVWEDAAIAPIYWYTRVTCTKPYVNRTFSQHGHEALEKWSLQP